MTRHASRHKLNNLKFQQRTAGKKVICFQLKGSYFQLFAFLISIPEPNFIYQLWSGFGPPGITGCETVRTLLALLPRNATKCEIVLRGNWKEDLVLVLGSVSTLAVQLMCRQSQRWTNTRRVIKNTASDEKLWTPMSQNNGTGIWKKEKEKGVWSLKQRKQDLQSSFWGFGENLYNGSRHLVMKIEPKN